MLENFSSDSSFLGAIITLTAAIITLAAAIISNKNFINQDWGSHVGYSLTNFKQQSQHVRSKIFKLTRDYMCMIISNIILYYCCTEILSVLVSFFVKEIGIAKIDAKNIGSPIGWLYFFIWFVHLLYVLVQSDVGRIIFEDIKKIKTKEKIEDWFFKLIYGYSFGFVSYILFIELCALILKHIDYRSLKESLCLLKSPWFYIVLFLFLVFFFLLVVFCFFSKKSKGNHRKAILTDFTKLKLILYYCTAFNPLALCISLDWLDMKSLNKYLQLNKDLQLNMDFLENILRLGIVVAINLVVVIIAYRISDRFYSKMMNTAFLYYEQGSDKRYIYRKIDNQFLCGNKDYLQCEREAFYKNIREMRKTIEDKYGRCNEEGKNKLCKWINKLALYSGYIRIDEGDKYFEKLKRYIDSDTATVVGIETELIKMIEEFQEMTAVELVSEDELKDYIIYPIIDKERNRFFN